MKRIILALSLFLLAGCHAFEEHHGIDKVLFGGHTYSNGEKDTAPHKFVACCPGDGGFCQQIRAAGGSLFLDGTWYDAICGLPVSSN